MTDYTHEMLLGEDEIAAIKSAIELVAAFVVEDEADRLTVPVRERTLWLLENIADRFPGAYETYTERYTERGTEPAPCRWP